MIASSRKSTLSPPVTRHFDFSRLQDQLITCAYEALIPVVSTSPRKTARSRLRQGATANPAFPTPRPEELDQPCPTDNLRVAIYARVSWEQQEKEDTIASQLEALIQRIASDALECDPELCFVDDGYSGSTSGPPRSRTAPGPSRSRGH